MPELKEFRLTVSGKADVVIHDGPNSEALALRVEHRGGAGFSDTGISGFRTGRQRNRRNEVHEEAKT
jgi:hypothetical protein